MTQEALVVGIDVSKAMLDVVILPAGESLRFENTPKGRTTLVRRLAGGEVSVAAFEATGGYERGLLKALCKAGIRAARINPARVRDFARASGVLAKNDRIDALMIARFAASLPPRSTESDPVREDLADLVMARRQFSEELTRATNQAGQTVSAVVRRINQRRVRRIEAELKVIELEIAKAVSTEDRFASKAALMRSVPGVGAVTSSTLLALMPELGLISNRAIASLVGVAPFDHDSGRFRGHRTIWGGRQAVRDVLYMAALAAIRAKSSRFRTFYQALVQRGKKPKVAIVAVIRKLAVTLNAMLRDNQPWQTA